MSGTVGRHQIITIFFQTVTHTLQNLLSSSSSEAASPFNMFTMIHNITHSPIVFKHNMHQF